MPNNNWDMILPMVEPPYSLNQSQLADWFQCRWRWYYTHARGVSPLPGGISEKLDLGSAVHVGIAAALRTPDWDVDAAGAAILVWYQEQLQKLPGGELGDSIREVLAQVMAKAVAVTGRTLSWLGGPETWEILSLPDGTPLIEHTLEGVVTSSAGQTVRFHGTPDWVGRHRPSGTTWLVDNKVREKFKDEESEQWDIQKPIYQLLLYRQYGLETTGSMTLQIKSGVPEEPQINRSNGKVSRTHIPTDWETYRRAVLAAGQNPEDYDDVRSRLLEYEWFRMNRAYRPLAMLDRFWEEVVVPASRDILDVHLGAHDSPEIYRSVGFICGQCKIRELCLADLRGDDVPYLLRTKYLLDGATYDQRLEEYATRRRDWMAAQTQRMELPR